MALYSLYQCLLASFWLIDKTLGAKLTVDCRAVLKRARPTLLLQHHFRGKI